MNLQSFFITTRFPLPRPPLPIFAPRSFPCISSPHFFRPLIRGCSSGTDPEPSNPPNQTIPNTSTGDAAKGFLKHTVENLPDLARVGSVLLLLLAYFFVTRRLKVTLQLPVVDANNLANLAKIASAMDKFNKACKVLFVFLGWMWVKEEEKKKDGAKKDEAEKAEKEEEGRVRA